MDFYAVNGKVKGFFGRLFGAVGRFFKAVGRFFTSLFAGWREKTEKSPLLRPVGPTGAVTEFILRFLWTVFIAAGLYLIMKNSQTPVFYGDASGYYAMSKLFVKDGVFDFANCPTGPRGYFFPYMIYLMRQFGRAFSGLADVRAYYAGYALFLSATLVFALPYIFEKLTKKRQSVLKSFLFALVLWAFWGTELSHPLTDIPAVALLIISVAAFLKLSEGGRSPFWAFICGAAAAGAYSARQVYLIYLIAIIVIAIIQILFAKEKMIKGEQKGKILLKLRARLARFQDKYGYFVAAGKKAIKIAILLFSVVLVMIPQVMINERYYETSDWQPKTGLYTLAVAGVEDYPLLVYNANGLRTYARVDFIVTDKRDPGAIAVNIYPGTNHGEDHVDFYTYKDYFADIFKHPGWYIREWFRSAFLGMTDTYDTSYVTNVKKGVVPRLLGNYLMLAVFLVFTVVSFIRLLRGKFPKPKLTNVLFAVLIFAIILSGLVNCLTKMETRYLMPWYFIVYAVLCFRVTAGFSLKPEKLAIFGKKIIKYSGPVLLVVFIFLIIYIPELMKTTILWNALIN